jgi:LPXTG-site transpeptidase (sortase) family protein
MHMKSHLARPTVVIILLALLLATAGLVYAEIGDTKRVSVTSSGIQGNGYSNTHDVSADGRYVVFTSGAANLVPNDTNGAGDIFIRDGTTGSVTRVSVSEAGVQGNAISSFPAISADGRYVGFSSSATNLVPNDTNGEDDIFVHDRVTGAITRVSVNSNGVQATGGGSLFQSFSSDGSLVTFVSAATNLVAGDTNGFQDIFLHNLVTGTTTRVSVSSTGVQANNHSNYPSISAEGCFIAFQSGATNLVPTDTNGFVDVFVHDCNTGATTLASLTSSGLQANGHSSAFGDMDISGDGRYVAFYSSATNLVAGDTNGFDDVFVRDRSTGATTRVSVSSEGAEADNNSSTTSISFFGRYVVFQSLAANLVPGDTNGVRDVFAHDLLLGRTTRVSVSSGGEQGDADSGFFIGTPRISLDGRYAVYASDATNLVPGDTNGFMDVFIHDYLGPPDPPEPECFWVGSPGGVFRLDKGAVVIIPPGSVPDGSCLQGDVFAHPGPDSAGTYPLTFAIDIHLTEGPNGAELTWFSPPLEICMPVTDAIINKADGEGNLRLSWRESMDDSKPWTFLSTLVKKVDGHGEMACSSLSHLTVFTIVEAGIQALPATGFAPGVVTDLDLDWRAVVQQRSAGPYALDGFAVSLQSGEMILEIPRIGVRAPIMGVPETTAGWDVSWLGDSVGWMAGTAFPTWEGNTALTGHVYDADGEPGVFANLRTLWWGDRIVVRAWGEEHSYAVRSVRQVDADDETWSRHDKQDWLTLVTCRGFDETTGEYRWRTVVRAVRVE